jgi:hypothetical protein
MTLACESFWLIRVCRAFFCGTILGGGECTKPSSSPSTRAALERVKMLVGGLGELYGTTPNEDDDEPIEKDEGEGVPRRW